LSVSSITSVIQSLVLGQSYCQLLLILLHQS